MKERRAAFVAYLGLLILSLPVPLLDLFRTGRVIEAMRPGFRSDDGGWVSMTLPFPLLLLRWLGDFSCIFPVLCLALLLLACRRQELTRPKGLLTLGLLQFVFTTLYAAYSTLLLGSMWLDK